MTTTVNKMAGVVVYVVGCIVSKCAGTVSKASESFRSGEQFYKIKEKIVK